LNVISRLQKGLTKTRANLIDGITRVVSRARAIDEDFLEELEEQLILGDVGVNTAEEIIQDLRKKIKENGVNSPDEIIAVLRREMIAICENSSEFTVNETPVPLVISIIGVNGTGKTTSIGKLAYRYRQQGKKVLLAAGDTFRAAAIEQLDVWASRAGAEIVRNRPGADPASVAFDALKACLARNFDVLIIDTAGRLHTKTNLMAELSKIHRVLDRHLPGAPHRVLLVMDASTGQNGLSQVKNFAESVNIDGIILTKLDGTAKGGIVFALARMFGIPVRYIGVGENIEDLEVFEPRTFVEALFR
jgi:fused signal recognition particle receptor